MKRIVFITPPEPPHGFAIAGFEQLMTEEERAEDNLLQTAREPDVGVIIIDERLLGEVGEESLRKLHEQWGGILLVLPTPAGTVPVEEDYLQRLIRRALGYHVRIRE
jgi:V/A-type H+-transporting ATPase subunit F